MTIKEQSILSYYKELMQIGKNESVYLVKHQISGKIYIRKTLRVYDKDVMLRLKEYEFPGIPRIYECIEDEDKLILIEEYIHGDNLEEIRKKHMGEFPEVDAIGYAIDICNILRQIHSVEPPIIHRDIKPENIMISADRVIKLIDFNGARIASDSGVKDTVLFGTEGFASPEQYGFGKSDQRTDIYGLGVTLNYLITGRELAYARSDGDLGRIIEKCTQMDPAMRYQNADELKYDLLRSLNTRDSKRIHNHPSAEKTYDRDWYDERSAEPNYSLPGFRTNVIWKKIIAVLGYAMIIYFSREMEIEKPLSNWDPFLSKITVFVMLMASVLWFFNYCNIQSVFPGMRKNRLLSIILSLLYWIVIIFAIALAYAVIVTILP